MLQEDKVVLITGGTGGIGSSIAQLCKKRGWKVCITGKKKINVEKIMKDYGSDMGFEWSADDQEGIKRITQDIIGRFGKINALINAVGVLKSKPFMEIDAKTALEEYETNVLGTIFPIQAVIPYMQDNNEDCSIVNISSMRGVQPLASGRSINYSITKAGIVSLTSALAKLYSPKIRINAIAPGFTISGMSKDWSEQSWLDAKENNLYKRPANPDEIARHIMFMISEDSSYMTGQTILVDGGFSIYKK